MQIILDNTSEKFHSYRSRNSRSLRDGKSDNKKQKKKKNDNNNNDLGGAWRPLRV